MASAPAGERCPVKRFEYLVVSLTCALGSPAMAQFGPAPNESQWANPSNQWNNPTAHVTQVCQASIPIPAENIGRSDIPVTYQGTCPTGKAEGQLTVQASDKDAPAGTTISSYFVNGKASGKTTISIPKMFSFDGDIPSNGIMRGKFTFVDYQSDGEYRNGSIYTGRIFRAASMGGGTNYFAEGQLVTEAAYLAASKSAFRLPEHSSTTYPLCQSPTFLKGADGVTRTLCRSKPASGMLTLTAPSKDGHTYSYSGQFVSGLMVGQISFKDETSGLSFLGTMNGYVRGNGITTFADGTAEYGAYQGNKLHTGFREKPASFNQTIKLQIENGQLVGLTESQQIAAIEERFNPRHLATMTKVSLGRNKTCLADIPSKLFTVKSAELPGRCVDGYYSGIAELELIPLAGNSLPPMKLSLGYQAGAVIGPVKANYTTLGETFEGQMVNWLPRSGESEKHIGNRNYQITEWQQGQPVSQLVEYRPPSETEQALTRIVIKVVEAGIDCTIGDCAERRRTEKRAYRAEQARKDDLAAQQQQFEVARQQNEQRAKEEREGWARVAQQQETDRRNSQAAINEGMRRASLDPDGTPISTPVQVANNDRPVVSTNQPVFGGSTSSQEPDFGGSTRPPELPGPHAGRISLPDPVTGPVQVAGLPAPVTVGTNVVPPPLASPVQLPNQNDTLGTGQAPSIPVSQPVEVIGPARPSQPASSSSNASGAKPETPSNTRTNTSASPRITMQWNLVQGATYYDLGLRDLSNGQLIISQQVSGSGVTTDLVRGGNYRWNVAACNQSGCSAYSSPQQFSIAGNSPSQSSTFGFTADDTRWMQSLPIELQVQVLRLTGAQVQAYKDRGEWLRFKQVVTQAAGEMRNAESEEQREKLAIWERAWSQSQRVLIEGSLWLIPVERIAAAAYDMSKVVRGARVVAETPRGVGATGIIGETWLKTLGGRSQVPFQTTRGMRYVDQVVGRIGHESKVGYQSLSGDIPEQIAKDQLLLVRDLDSITWHFFRSPTTGQIGPSAPLREALRKAGIQIIEHPNP